MKQILSSLLIVVLLFVMTTQALDDSSRAAGCSPPMSFAKEHNCTLKYSMNNEVAAYDCDKWYVQGDCEGGVISFKDDSLPQTSIIILTVILVIVFVVLLVILVYMINKKPKEDEFNEAGYY